MASSKDFELDWSMVRPDSSGWTIEDLQLAAELGKTLLERNKELENALKQHQNAHEDQAQEIEYLTKQNVALREVNESRLRIYEQLEVSIQDLERANHRLLLENSSGKKQIKTLKASLDGLETKCEDLQATIDDLNNQIEVLRTKTIKPSSPVRLVRATPPAKPAEEERPISPDLVTKTPNKEINVVKTVQQNVVPNEEQREELTLLTKELEQLKVQATKDERKCRELEEQLASVMQDNTALENQLNQIHQRGSEMKSMQEELTTLEEVRQGQMCSKCLRNMDSSDSLIPEEDDAMLPVLVASTPETIYRTSFHLDVQGDSHSSPLDKDTSGESLYKNLAAKYEALVEVQRQPIRPTLKPGPSDNCLSLQDEMQMSGDFTTHLTKDTDEESGHGDSLRPEKTHKLTRKTFSHTPTDFSEAETSSSGFADETSNKGTQTEASGVGSFVCTIADGDDCKFSIYDDVSPVNSRFSKHRELVNEILSALKIATEAQKHVEEDLVKVSPKTPVLPQIMDLLEDDRQSVLSSTLSELSMTNNEPTTVIENIIQSQNQPIPEPAEAKAEPILRPLVREQFEETPSKRSASRRRRRLANERSDSPATPIIGSPKINYAKRASSGRNRRKDRQPAADPEPHPNWNGNTLEYWSRKNIASPTPSQSSAKSFLEFKPSTASQDLNKLKQLDRSYAEVVRLTSKNDQFNNKRRK